MCSHPRPGRAPHTPFSTEFKGGARAVRERLRIQTASHAFDLARRYLSGIEY